MSSPTQRDEAAFLGLIQGLIEGLIEFLPVSSSAHLRAIGPLLTSGGDPGVAFKAITHRPAGARQNPTTLVLAGARWFDAVRMRSLQQHLRRDCGSERQPQP